MSGDPYQPYIKSDKNQMLMRDYLAIDRTIMSNEVSFLAYIRTSLTLLIAGITILKFIETGWIITLAWVLIALAGLLFVQGFIRYDENDQMLHRIRQHQLEDPDHSLGWKRFVLLGRRFVQFFV